MVRKEIRSIRHQISSALGVWCVYIIKYNKYTHNYRERFRKTYAVYSAERKREITGEMCLD